MNPLRRTARETRRSARIRREGEAPATFISNLPQEIVMEILSWVPTKSLLRFRCVSKTWLRLLTLDPHFINLHLNRLQIKHNNNNDSHQNPGVLLIRKDRIENLRFYFAVDYKACDEAIQLQFPFNDPVTFMDYEVCGICNGLVCLRSCFGHCREVYVWNPLTGEHITIQCPPMAFSFPNFARNSLHLFSCYRDSNNEYKYKVIRLVCISTYFVDSIPKFHSQVSAYTLGTDSWRTIQDIPYLTSSSFDSHALVGGVLHWIARRPESYSWDAIVSLDLKTEVVREIPHPCPSYPSEDSLGELGGLLCLFCVDPGKDIQIWVMKQHGVANSWTKQFTIGRPMLRGSFEYLEPLALTVEGEIIIKKNSQRIILYNPKTNSIRDLNRFPFRAYDACAFKGSLVSPRLINGDQSITGMEECGGEQTGYQLHEFKVSMRMCR